MTDHSIKVTRALGMADIGRYHASASAMLKAVPDCVVERLASADLAALLDSMWALAEKSKSIAEREIIDEGGVWDAGESHLALTA